MYSYRFGEMLRNERGVVNEIFI